MTLNVSISSNETSYEKYAWILVFIPGLVYGLLSLMPIIGGYYYVHTEAVMNQAVPPSTPTVTINYLNNLARSDGLQALALGLLLAGIAATSFRKGVRLAWYVALWFFLLSVISTSLDIAYPLPSESESANILVIGLVALMGIGVLLPYRKFFPSKRTPSADPTIGKR
jgi:hypothetical protein